VYCSKAACVCTNEFVVWYTNSSSANWCTYLLIWSTWSIWDRKTTVNYEKHKQSSQVNASLTIHSAQNFAITFPLFATFKQHSSRTNVRTTHDPTLLTGNTHIADVRIYQTETRVRIKDHRRGHLPNCCSFQSLEHYTNIVYNVYYWILQGPKRCTTHTSGTAYAGMSLWVALPDYRTKKIKCKKMKGSGADPSL
jgi:hypothetical protein